jgi:hypothetical protein
VRRHLFSERSEPSRPTPHDTPGEIRIVGRKSRKWWCFRLQDNVESRKVGQIASDDLPRTRDMSGWLSTKRSVWAARQFLKASNKYLNNDSMAKWHICRPAAEERLMTGWMIYRYGGFADKGSSSSQLRVSSRVLREAQLDGQPGASLACCWACTHVPALPVISMRSLP